MPQEIKNTLDFKNVGKIVNLPDGVDPQDAATVHQLATGSGTAIWGGITGTLSSQTDLQSALDAKENTITAGANSQFWRGDKTWQSLESAVLATGLSGLSITGGAVTSSDNVLSAFGKLQNQINAVLGGATYQGVWNASTNSPALASGVGTKGFYYVVSVDGATNLDGITDWKVGDWAIYNGTTWDKVDNTDAVSSVNGAIGAISLAGTTNRISVSGTTFDIASTYAGQSSINTVGTIATGVWNGTAIGSAYGGTGLTTYAKGDVLIATGTNTVGVVNAPTTDGYVFTYDLASGLPMWKAASGGGSLPSMAGNASKFLTNDGSTASWGSISNFFLGNANNEGGTSAYSATIAEVTALVAGQIFILKFLHAATSTAATLNINGYGVKSIFKNGTTVTNGTDFGGENQYSILQYDGSNFQLVENNMINVAYLNGFQTFTSNNTFNNSLYASGILATSSSGDYRCNLYIPTGTGIRQLSASLQMSTATICARVLLGSGDTEYTGNGDSTSVYIVNQRPGVYSGVYKTISSLLVKKPNGNANPVYATITDFQTAYFDDAPTGGVNNWSINAGVSKFRGGIVQDGMTTTDIAAIATPSESRLVYDKTLHKYKFWNGSAWETITSA